MRDSTDPIHDRHNVELKARLHSLDDALATCQKLGATDRGVLVQTDTYFNATVGRLKLREIQGSHNELIWYERSNSTDARLSKYQLVPVPDALALKTALTGAVGTCGVVNKRRRLFMYQNVRIHLDDVAGLGIFIEFEAVCGPDDAEADQYAKIAMLRTAFGIHAGDEISTGYVDLPKA